MLDAPYFMFAGSLSHPDTFDAGLVNRIVPGALGNVVASSDHGELTDAYVTTAKEVVAAGATLLTTNCGFAVVYQEPIRQHVGVPIVGSTLPWLNWLHAIHGERVGVLTWDASQLDAARRLAAGWDPAINVPVADVQHVDAWRRLAHTDPTDAERVEMKSGLLRAAERFASGDRLAALLLECTGFAPFSQDVARTTGLPTFDIVTAVRRELHAQAIARPAAATTKENVDHA